MLPNLFNTTSAESGAQVVGEGEGGLPYSFLYIERSDLILGKKCPDCVQIWAKFLI